MKLVIYLVLGIVALGGGGAGAYYFGALDGLLGIEEEVDPNAEVEEEVDDRPNLFHTIPPLTVSSILNGNLHYLQVKMSVLTKDEDTIELLEDNSPLIQDSLIMLLDSYDLAYLANVEGKEELRSKAEEEMRGLIDEGEIESLLFTGFVIQ
ncbi:MAG: flagellar basal body-associated FliL family protein [Pseudomonadales bacterium]|nr:flagellar basal body-associated FliL family protein [Pseudomonadales bacterium]